MAAHIVSASMPIQAPPQDVYDIIADYHHGHPAILPKPPFIDLVVERGGRGAGTTIRVGMRVLGQRQTFRAEVTEPEPGRVLVETNDTGYVTSFIVEPRDGGRGSHVTISSDLSGRRGIAGWLERRLMPRMLQPMFVRELELLAARAERRQVSTPV